MSSGCYSCLHNDVLVVNRKINCLDCKMFHYQPLEPLLSTVFLCFCRRIYQHPSVFINNHTCIYPFPTQFSNHITCHKFSKIKTSIYIHLKQSRDRISTTEKIDGEGVHCNSPATQAPYCCIHRTPKITQNRT